MLRALVLRWSAHGAVRAHHLTHDTKCTFILLFHRLEFKKLVSVEDTPSVRVGKEISSHAYGLRLDGK